MVILELATTTFLEVKKMPVEGIMFIFFILVLGPLIAVLAYCGVRGTCGENEEEDKGLKEKGLKEKS